MKFTNRQFGEMEFEQKHVIEFPEGIVGFRGNKRFLIVDDADSQPFRWLVSLEDPDLSFAMIDPSPFLPDYKPKFFRDPGVSVFQLVALKEPVQESSVNLRSPVVIEGGGRTGRQVILEDEALDMHFPLFLHRTNSEK